MSDLYFNDESDYFEENTYVTIKSFAPPFFNHFSLNLNKKNVWYWESLEKAKHIKGTVMQIWKSLYMCVFI